MDAIYTIDFLWNMILDTTTTYVLFYSLDDKTLKFDAIYFCYRLTANKKFVGGVLSSSLNWS